MQLAVHSIYKYKNKNWKYTFAGGIGFCNIVTMINSEEDGNYNSNFLHI